MANTISNSDDVIDSRDVIARIKELEDERQSLLDEIEEATNSEPAEKDEKIQAIGDANFALEEWDESEEATELKALKALQSDAEGYSDDWLYGSTLIRDSYFEESMDDMVADCYAMPKDLPSFIIITLDYDALKMDYTEVDFDGVAYFIR